MLHICFNEEEIGKIGGNFLRLFEAATTNGH
jgi:hypothetical protein